MPVYAQASSANDAAAITPSDSTAVAFDAVYVGTTGNLAVTTGAGTVVTFPSVPAGYILPIRCVKVMSTNTTATNLVGMKY